MTPENTAKVIMEINGMPPVEKHYIAAERLITHAGPHAKVGFHIGRTIGYGDAKVTAICELYCDQNEAMIEAGSTRAFFKALEMFDDGMAIVMKRLEAEQPG